MTRKVDFPLLQEFARGYLHQDLAPEHGNTKAAAEAYVRDLPAKDHPRLSSESKRMQAAAQHWTVQQLNEAFAKLGASWKFESKEEFLAVFRIFEHHS